MEINKLQICDIVTFAECLEDGCVIPIKIEALGYQGDWDDAEENNALVKIGDSVGCDIIAIDESIVGIPLTTEMLKMNGWIYNDEEAKYAPETWVGNNLMLHEDNGRFRIVVVSDYDDEDTNNTPFIIQYVHELQHALRLCGRKDVANKLKIDNNYEN